MGSRKMIVRQVAYIQRKLSKTSFSQIGSLYEDLEGAECSRFHVGAFSPPVQFERPRKHRGPWATARGQMKEVMEEKLKEIASSPEKILSSRMRNGREEMPKRFKELYEAILHLVNSLIYGMDYTLFHIRT